MIVRPIYRDAAIAWIREHHRHNLPPQGWLFGTAVVVADRVVGVGTAGRAVARGLDTVGAIEVTRVCLLEDAPKNAASKIYGALCGAAKSLGFVVAYTYTLASETGTSVRAAGFRVDAHVRARATHRHGR